MDELQKEATADPDASIAKVIFCQLGPTGLVVRGLAAVVQPGYRPSYRLLVGLSGP